MANCGGKKKKRGEAYQEVVAKVAATLYSNAKIEMGQWVDGPDGQRELDVTVKPKDGKSDEFFVIECKDWNRPIGIGNIDALDSKRRDIGAKLVMICSNSGFTGEALRKAARVGIPALAALVEGDKRIRVVVREQIYTRKIKFNSSKTVFHHQQLSKVESAQIVPPLYTREYLYNGRPLQPWIAEKWMRLARNSVFSRRVHMGFRFSTPLGVTLRKVHLLVNAIEVRADFTVQWMTQVAEIGASEGMYDYLHKQVVSGASSQFHLKNVNTKTWGVPVDISEVPPRLFVPIEQRLNAGHILSADEYMTFVWVEGLPGADPKDAPKLDLLLASEEITDVPKAMAGA